MELRDVAEVGSDEGHLPSDASLRAMIAFDQLADVEKAAVLASLQLLEHDGSPLLSTAQATRLEGPEPLYVLRPAPDVRVLVRAGAGGMVEVLDIIRPALRNFAHAI